MSIMNDDISTYMCTSISKATSIILVSLIGHSLSLRQSELENETISQIMMVTYVMCYLILKTAMEPLNACIKAVYVSFAQHPHSFSQAFPLLYHRLNRMCNE